MCFERVCPASSVTSRIRYRNREENKINSRFNCFHKIACVSNVKGCLLAYNGLGICDGAVIEFRQLSFVLKLDRITEVEHLTSSRTIANTLLQAVLF